MNPNAETLNNIVQQLKSSDQTPNQEVITIPREKWKGLILLLELSVMNINIYESQNNDIAKNNDEIGRGY